MTSLGRPRTTMTGNVLDGALNALGDLGGELVDTGEGLVDHVNVL